MYVRLGFNLINLLCEIIGLFELCIIIRAVLSWVSNPMSGVNHFFTALTEPVVNPVRRVVNRVVQLGSLDISPAVTLILLELLKRLIYRLF